MATLPISLALAVFIPLAASMGAPPQVPISVYYESLCPDSIAFFTKQLYPTFTSNVQQRLNLTLIPYGKSVYEKDTDGKLNFICHHGPNECYGNKIQACAIKKLPDQPKLLSLINCLMGTVLADRNGTYPIKICADKTGVTPDEIINCANGTEGSTYLAALGDETADLHPKLTSVPTIILNSTYSDENQKLALSNLRGLICNMISGEKPTGCTAGSAAVTLSVSALLFLSILHLF